MNSLPNLGAFRALAFIALAFFAGCAQAPNGPAAATAQADTAQTQAMKAYGDAIIQTIKSDQVLAQILANGHVTNTLEVGLRIDPNGYVEKGYMVKTSAAPAVEQAVLGHLINVNFGNFSPDMPNRPLLFFVPVKPPATGPFQMQSIVLYQPNSVLVARLGNAAPLAAYIGQVEASVSAVIAAAPPQPGVTAAIVIGVKPGGQSRAWIVQPGDSLSPALVSQIESAAEGVLPVPVNGGPIAFAMIFNAWGCGPPITNATHQVPMPKEWLSGAPTAPETVPDGVFARIWP